MRPVVKCPNCQKEAHLEQVLTSQSNQNVIYTCNSCEYTIRNIETSKG